ncbi:MAG: DNA polymerase III subunit alpha [Aerococcus sp.]|nr:DNA polymerase III subunit alpha [Aerococcus sp.]
MIPLHVNSCYSLLHSPLSIDQYVTQAADTGYRVIGLADENVLYGALMFYRAAKAHGLTPLIGMTVTLPSGVRPDENEQLIIYARSYAGYQRLMMLSTLLKKSESIDRQEIMRFILDADNHQDWIVIFGARYSPIINALKHGDAQAADQLAEEWHAKFTEEQLYIGVSPYAEDLTHIDALQQFAAKYRIPLLALPYITYGEADDYFALCVMQALAKNQSIEDIAHVRQQHNQDYLRSTEAFEQQFEAMGLTDCVARLESLAPSWAFEMPKKRRLLPKFPVPDEQTPADYLRTQVEKGMIARLGVTSTDAIPDAYTERLAHELDTIHEMGFDDYFLIVWDVIDYAKHHHIRTGPGRGSAAGSLVAYALGITGVDPIENHLLFERFLNPERQNMPDIDLDFPDNRRNDVVRYVYNKYGADHVAQISTFGTFKAKSALREVGRMIGETPKAVSAWTKAIKLPNASIATNLKESPALQRLVSQHPHGELWLNTAQTLEQLPRNISTHAAGVIISDAPLTEYVPLQHSNSDAIHQSQMTKDDVEGLGLLKMDFLSLINLTILDDAVRDAERFSQHTLNPEVFDQTDPAVYRIFQRAETDGVFQFESPGIRQVLRRLQPTTMNDIAAVNALFRPGPMKQIDHYIARKHGKEPVSYPDDAVADILENTYGIMVYQEQVMQVAQRIAGFTLGEADILRRAMSKKDAREMAKQRENFVKGSLQNGFTEDKALEIFQYISEFAEYGFNKSHAFAYAYLAYELAWLKVHYPTSFYYGNIKSNRAFEKKGISLLKEAMLRGVTVKAPSVQSSYVQIHSIDPHTLQLGIGDIKGIPHATAVAIVTEREQNGHYRDLNDFVIRLPKQLAKVDALSPLVKAGAMDDFGFSRRALLEENLEKACHYVTVFSANSGASADLFSTDLFGESMNDYMPRLTDKPEYSTSELIANEVATLGQAIKTKLFEDYEPYYQSGQLTVIEEITGNANRYTAIGELSATKRITTKRKQPMAFAKLSDETGTIDLTLFPDTYRYAASALHDGNKVLVIGRAEQRNDHVQLVVSKMQELSDETRQQLESARKQQSRQQKDSSAPYHIRVANRSQATAFKQELLALIAEYPGKTPITIHMVAEQKQYQLGDNYCLADQPHVLQRLQQIYGSENVKK